MPSPARATSGGAIVAKKNWYAVPRLHADLAERNFTAVAPNHLRLKLLPSTIPAKGSCTCAQR